MTGSPAGTPVDGRPPSVDLRSALALLVVASLVGVAGWRWPLVGWLALLVVAVALFRALAFVVVARQAGVDPEESHPGPKGPPPATAPPPVSERAG